MRLRLAPRQTNRVAMGMRGESHVNQSSRVFPLSVNESYMLAKQYREFYLDETCGIDLKRILKR